ncbi:zinc finger FYVE domain-containing protein 16 [Platysternon megacephalum]|uniref:Zinc finger FYVE domain-containing protein 16 n=1 Tax=Platysternon megacephalum TaxID=55544 RepID=A0A4D9EZG7_9SAUR|nr:zinc finger FYVE domain-containing protein 16 [Platysternon megacephalum]
MQTFLKGKRVGYWLSEKKIKKLNFQAFAELCRKRGIEVIQLDLTKPIEDQGPLDVIIHKLTDVILEADQNDSQSLELVYRFQEYIDAHPETIILDPLPAIRTLLDRSKSYELIRRIEAYMQAWQHDDDDVLASPQNLMCLYSISRILGTITFLVAGLLLNEMHIMIPQSKQTHNSQNNAAIYGYKLRSRSKCCMSTLTSLMGQIKTLDLDTRELRRNLGSGSEYCRLVPILE